MSVAGRSSKFLTGTQPRSIEPVLPVLDRRAICETSLTAALVIVDVVARHRPRRSGPGQVQAYRARRDGQPRRRGRGVLCGGRSGGERGQRAEQQREGAKETEAAGAVAKRSGRQAAGGLVEGAGCRKTQLGPPGR